MAAPPHAHDLSPWQHGHHWAADRRANERRTHAVIAITLVTMAAEIAAGWVVAVDGAAGRRLAHGHPRRGDRRGRAGLCADAALGRRRALLARAVEGRGAGRVHQRAAARRGGAGDRAPSRVLRLVSPRAVDYGPSLGWRSSGWSSTWSARWLLHAPAGRRRQRTTATTTATHHACHDHDHAHHGHEAHDGTDLNLKAAYLHVLADAATSVLAIAALLAGKYAGMAWLDPAMGLVGAAVIAWWSRGLLARTGKILLDREMDDPVADDLRQRLEADGDAAWPTCTSGASATSASPPTPRWWPMHRSTPTPTARAWPTCRHWPTSRSKSTAARSPANAERRAGRACRSFVRSGCRASSAPSRSPPATARLGALLALRRGAVGEHAEGGVHDDLRDARRDRVQQPAPKMPSRVATRTGLSMQACTIRSAASSGSSSGMLS